MPFTTSQKSPFVTSDNISRFDYNDNRPAHNDHATTWRRLHQTWHFFSRRRPSEFSPRFCSIIPSYTCCLPMLDFQIWYHKPDTIFYPESCHPLEELPEDWLTNHILPAESIGWHNKGVFPSLRYLSRPCARSMRSSTTSELTSARYTSLTKPGSRPLKIGNFRNSRAVETGCPMPSLSTSTVSAWG